MRRRLLRFDHNYFLAMSENYILYAFVIFIILNLIVTLIAFVDVLRSDFRGQNDKMIWVLVLLLSGWIGAAAYYFIGTKQKINGK